MQDRRPVRYDAVFRKGDDMIYISHLDLMSLFRRAIRRTGLPFVLTKGFTPRVKISIPKALKLGRQGDREEMSFWLSREVPAEGLAERINGELPEGVEILEVRN